MSTLIVGCGYLGRRVGAILAARNEQVFGTTRSDRRAQELESLGITPVITDVLDPKSLTNLPNVDRVLYCVGYDRAGGVSLRTVYVDGLNAVLGALKDRSKTLVYASSTGVHGQNDGRWIDEESPAEPTSGSGRACLDAESLVLGQAGRGGRVVRFSGLYGPGRIIRRAALERGEPIPGDSSKFLNLIHIQDAALAALAVLDRGTAGRIYLASDDRPVTRKTYYRLAAKLLNAPEPVFTAAPTTGGEESNKRVSNLRIKTELGFVLSYPDIYTGLPAALAENGSADQSPGAGSI